MEYLKLDYPSMLAGVVLCAFAMAVWALLFVRPRKPEVSVDHRCVCRHGNASECRGNHPSGYGSGPSTLAVLLAFALAGPAMADEPEPFDGPVSECADLLGRYVKCPEPAASPGPAPTPRPSPTPDPTTCATCQRVEEPAVKPVDAPGDDEVKPKKENKQKPATLGFAAGALALLGGGVEQDVTVEPGVSLSFDGPLFKSDEGKATRLEIDARFGALQGATATGFDENTVFRSLALAGRLCQPLSDKLFFLPCVEAGFATRLEGDVEPRFTAPRWFSLQIKALNARGDFISVGIGADERLDEDYDTQTGPYYRPAVQVAGSVRLWGPETTTKVHLRLVGQAILAIRYAGAAQTPADRVTLGILVAR